LDTDLRGLPPSSRRIREHQQVSSASRLEKPVTRPVGLLLMEPATGNRCPGQPGRAAISAALGSGPWQPRQRNTRMCPPRVGANAAPPHSRERECGCVTPEDARSQDGKNWHVLVASVQNGELCSPLTRYGIGLRDHRQGEQGYAPTTSVRFVKKEHRVALDPRPRQCVRPPCRTGPTARLRAARVKSLTA